jgi:hypothetical protein
MKTLKYILLCAALIPIIFIPRPVCAQDSFPWFKVKAYLLPEYRMFIPDPIRLDDIYDYSLPAVDQENQTSKNGEKKSRVSVNFSRTVVGGQRVDPFEDDKFNKWNMLKSLPGNFTNAQGDRERMEMVGKIFEPKVTLDIEF